MSNTNKYYIPEITDIGINYECEVYGQSTDKMVKRVEWYKAIVSWKQITGQTIVISNCKKLIKENHLRIPYLTKEQILNEGWILDKNSDHDFTKNNTYMSYNYISHDLKLEEGDLNTSDACDSYNIFWGECKSINEFRTICKWLKI